MNLRKIAARFAMGIALLALPVSLQTPTAGAVSGDEPKFARQAADAGLTPAEAKVLQDRVDALIAAHGGTQIAANKVQGADGKSATTLTLPGEKRARTLGAAGDVSSCQYGYLCMYMGTNYEGDRHDLYYCHTQSIWYNFNSWVNNQTGHTVAYFLDQAGQLYYQTPGAWSSNPNFYGGYVYSIDPC